MFGNILTRMIFKELVKVFGLALLAITGKMLLAGLISEASQHGLGPQHILTAIPLLIPSTLPYTIPVTTLFACCVVYGRLAADNEVLAIKASGVNVLHVLRPGLVLGVAMSGITLGLYYYVIPHTHHLLRVMVYRDAEELMYTILRKQRMLVHPQMPYSIYVKSVQGSKLINPIFKRKGAKGQKDVVAYAQEAELRVDTEGRNLQVLMSHGIAIYNESDTADFKTEHWDIPLPDLGVGINQRRPRDMTWEELNQREEELNEECQMTLHLIEQTKSHTYQPIGGVDQQVHLYHLNERLRDQHRQIRHLYVEKLMRPALSLGCLCFILVGCPVGIRSNRGDFLGSFMICFLPIVLLYYPLMLCGTNLAKEGKFDPFVLVWSANGLMILLGMWLLYRMQRN